MVFLPYEPGVYYLSGIAVELNSSTQNDLATRYAPPQGPRPRIISLPSQIMSANPIHISIQLHPLLQHGQHPHLEYDLQVSTPSSISRQLELIHANIQRLGLSLNDIATNPPLPSLTITSPHLPWPIIAHRSNLDCVTVEDVLRSLTQNLHLGVTHDASRLPINDRRRSDAVGTRLQFLRGKVRFIGLTLSQTQREVFEIHSM
jgi:hypothetical protein